MEIKIDTLILARFQAISDWFQNTFGIHCFQIARFLWVITTVLWVTMIYIISKSSISEFMKFFLLFLVISHTRGKYRFIGLCQKNHEENIMKEKETLDYLGTLMEYFMPLCRLTGIVVWFWLIYWLSGYSDRVPFGDLRNLYGYLLVTIPFVEIAILYFYNSKPKPPKKSKVKQFAESTKEKVEELGEILLPKKEPSLS